MPSRVPHRLFFQRLLFQLRDNILTYLRFLLVCFIWLGLVPFLARWIWRFYFRFGDWSADMTPPTNATMPEGNSTHVHVVFEDGLFGWLKGQDLWTSVLRDCFQGQIITICLVAVFVVVFLIREWVMQNALVADEIPIEQRELPQLAPFVDEPEVVDLPYAQGATGVQIEHPQDDVHDDFTPPGSETGPPTQWDDIPVGPDPFQDEPRFPDWARQRTDYLVDPFVRPPPQAEDVEAALALRPDLQRPEIPLPPPEPFNNFDFNREFDDDDIDAEDFDGLWDIIGMQGPIIGLLHNTVFSALMIALAVGLGVWLPFMFGKTALGALV
jgi:hypothetical protein